MAIYVSGDAEGVSNGHWHKKIAALIPTHMHDGIYNWIKYGYAPGDFLTAVLKNDLMEAMGRADEVNRLAMWDWCTYLYSYAPRGCFGSPASFSEWRKRGGLEGILKEEGRTYVD